MFAAHATKGVTPAPANTTYTYVVSSGTIFAVQNGIVANAPGGVQQS